MAYKIKNNAATTLAVGVNTTDTTLQVATGKGDLFPVISGSDHTRVTLENAAGDIEIVKVTARALGSDSMTVARAQEGTTAKTWLIGDIVELRVTAATVEDLQADTAAHLADTADAHAASAITNTPAGNITATTVQAAINELDTELSKLPAKASCRVATTANIALTGEQTIDGVAVVAGDRVLVMAQTAGAENGIYVAAAGAWARAEDANSAGDLTSGVLVPVESGTLNADTVWMLTTDGAITIGTTALAFQIKSGDASTVRKGLVQLATSAEAQALTDALKALTPATLAEALKGTNQSLAVNGYQKLPGGLIVQWGQVAATAATGTTTFPIAFPNNVFIQCATDYDTAGTAVRSLAVLPTLTNFQWAAAQGATAADPGTFAWFAVGN